jgi:hypothetical protein
MKNRTITVALSMMLLLAGSTWLTAQQLENTAGKMMQDEDRLTLGGYAQIDFNQPLDPGTYRNGKLDVHRMVLMLGYKFNEKTQFISELEFEHVSEVYVEQAFLQYEILPWLKFRGGLVLIPMGIINEYHEPTTYNGVERPNLDNVIVPSTWREIGAGFAGTFPVSAVSYQVYIVNGFSSYNGSGTLKSSNGFRSGRQKGADSFMSAPNLAFKLNYFGIQGLQLGFSGYAGQTQSTLFNGIDRNDQQLVAKADSSVVGLTMAGADAIYQVKGFQLRGQLNYGWVSNTQAYNEFTGNNLGSAISGWYGELSYNVFRPFDRIESELIPFVRYEKYNTHASVEDEISKNPAFNRSDLTFGIGWKISSGAMLKMDYQVFNNEGTNDAEKQFNAGVAIWF